MYMYFIKPLIRSGSGIFYIIRQGLHTFEPSCFNKQPHGKYMKFAFIFTWLALS